VASCRSIENSQFFAISLDQFVMPNLDSDKNQRLSRNLYEEIRTWIADGTYGVGAALPSTRALAAERSLSRGTVSLVYEQLAADGFIETRPGSASRVSSGIGAPCVDTQVHREKANHEAHGMPSCRLSAIGRRIAAMDTQEPDATLSGEIDFVYGPLSGNDFPTLLWQKALRAVECQRIPRLEYEDPRGNLELRLALQAHLSQTRGMRCTAEQIMIVNGSQQALDLCARLLVNPGESVVVENPGYRMAHNAFEAYGAKLLCVDVDSHGLCTDQLDQLGPARMAYVTPTHQFPLGAFLPIARRHALLAWAAARQVWVVEDDYDSEYRYSVRPEATLQSLDTSGCVIHVGTFSKTLSPQLRLGYMVLPPTLVEVFTAAKRVTDRHAATGVQRALARLLGDGSYDRHVRRMRRFQHARQRTLVDALVSSFGPRVKIEGYSSGLHLVAWFSEISAQDESALLRTAREFGVRVYSVRPLYYPKANLKLCSQSLGLVMGYGLLGCDAIESGVRRLASAIDQIRGRIF